MGADSTESNLAQALQREESTLLIACADPQDSALDRVRGIAPSALLCRSQDDLLAEVEAVVIATPHDLLAPMSVAALRRGKHVLAEKPIGRSVEEGRSIEDAAAQAKKVFMSGYSFRFSLSGHVHELLRQGAVGRVQAISGSISVGPMETGWQADPARGGGPLLYVGSHLIDAMVWFMGDQPRHVSAEMRRSPDTGLDITTSYRLGFADGVICQGLVTQAAAGFALDVQVVGTEGWLAVRGFNFLQFEVEVFSEALPAYAEPTSVRPWTAPDNIATMLMPEMREFAAAIREGQAPSITAADGTAVLRIIDGIRHSAESGDPVDLTDTAGTA